MMDARKSLSLELIARYKSEALARRDANLLNADSGPNSADPLGDSDAKASQLPSSKVNVTNRAGLITVETSGANLLPKSADKTKIFGRSNLSIPEYRLYRK
jgi:hypothetical protein